MIQDSKIPEALQSLYRHAAAAIGAVEKQFGASLEDAQKAESTFFQNLMEIEELAGRGEIPTPMRARLEKGVVQVYTGDGKGKTTAAFGLAARASAAGLRVCILQFLKGGIESGEVKSAFRLPGVRVLRSGSRYDPSQDQSQNEKLRSECQADFEKARLLTIGGLYDLIILDEINMAVFYKFITLDEIRHLIENKPTSLELVLTGRNAPQELIDMADLVTEMKQIKHPAEDGLPAREGIEF